MSTAETKILEAKSREGRYSNGDPKITAPGVTEVNPNPVKLEGVLFRSLLVATYGKNRQHEIINVDTGGGCTLHVGKRLRRWGAPERFGSKGLLDTNARVMPRKTSSLVPER